MVRMTVRFRGREREFATKKEMLQTVGFELLSEADMPMTLRQLYYRFVAYDLVENKDSQYAYLSEAIKDARLDGSIPWSWIEDRTRRTGAGDHSDVDPDDHFDNSLDSFRRTADRYYRPRWEGQDHYVEVWVEKEALAGIFQRQCGDLKVTSFPCRGYSSITMLKQAADRVSRAVAKGSASGEPKDAVILYFGDFDPSGQDIERNIRDTLNDTFHVEVDVRREALTRAQIDEHELPPQPAKRSDSRYEDFARQHGGMAVELDALEPGQLRGLIDDAVGRYFDEGHWEREVEPEQGRERGDIRDWVDEALAGYRGAAR